MTGEITTIEQALQHVRPVNPKLAQTSLTEVEPAIQRVIQLRNGLYPVESDAVGTIDQILTSLAQRQQQLAAIVNGEVAYPVFDPRPLSWRNKKGFPTLAPFSIYHPMLEFRVVGRRKSWDIAYTRETTPDLPEPLICHYNDVFSTLEKVAKQRESTVKLNARFKGIIPTSVKDEIATAQEHLNYIYVIAEVDDWQVDVIAIPQIRDPLVIGFDGANWRLIATFDLTPVENYIYREFCISLTD